MKSYALEPTDENIIEALADNLIDRNKDISRFMILLNCIEDSYSIALDGKWGSGKTFFVKQLKKVIEAYNSNMEESKSDDCVKIKNIINEYKNKVAEPQSFEPQIAVYYDSWANDNAVDPILSIIYEIIKSVNSDFSFKKSKDCLQVAGTIAEFFTGKNVTALFELAKADDPFTILKEQKDIHLLISDFLESILIEHGNRLVVLVDELDRCKPSYAVHLLERIKHYFSSAMVTFVFSVNLDELQHTIKQYYGNEFDACRYLDRFFDLRISLPPANLNKYYNRLGLNNENYIYEEICKEVIKANHFELRETAKYYQLAKVAAYKPTHGSSINFSFSEGKAKQFSLVCIVPIMLGLKISNIKRYNAFIQGKDSSPLLDIIGSGELAMGICSNLLNNNETFCESTQKDEIKVELIDKLSEAYDALFNKDYTYGTRSVAIGKMIFSKETLECIMRTAGLLSEFSDFS